MLPDLRIQFKCSVNLISEKVLLFNYGLKIRKFDNNLSKRRTCNFDVQKQIFQTKNHSNTISLYIFALFLMSKIKLTNLVVILSFFNFPQSLVLRIQRIVLTPSE